jgi:uncharacterized protein
MKIFVIAKPKSKKEYVRKIDNTHYIIAVKDPPVGGKANTAIINKLSEFFLIPKSQIFIVNGEKSKHKTIDVRITLNQLENLEPQKKLF